MLIDARQEARSFLREFIYTYFHAPFQHYHLPIACCISPSFQMRRVADRPSFFAFPSCLYFCSHLIAALVFFFFPCLFFFFAAPFLRLSIARPLLLHFFMLYTASHAMPYMLRFSVILLIIATIFYAFVTFPSLSSRADVARFYVTARC